MPGVPHEKAKDNKSPTEAYCIIRIYDKRAGIWLCCKNKTINVVFLLRGSWILIWQLKTREWLRVAAGTQPTNLLSKQFPGLQGLQSTLLSQNGGFVPVTGDGKLQWWILNACWLIACFYILLQLCRSTFVMATTGQYHLSLKIKIISVYDSRPSRTMIASYSPDHCGDLFCKICQWAYAVAFIYSIHLFYTWLFISHGIYSIPTLPAQSISHAWTTQYLYLPILTLRAWSNDS